MKAHDAKVMALLTVPAMGLAAFASLASIRSHMKTDIPPYRLTVHELIPERRMTSFEKELARIVKIPKGRAVCYRYAAKSHQTSILAGLIGEPSYNVVLNGSSCQRAHTKSYVPCSLSSGSPRGFSRETEGEGFIEIYDLDELLKANDDVVFSFPLTWYNDKNTWTRTVTLKVTKEKLREF
jgi:hypothetical protein